MLTLRSDLACIDSHTMPMVSVRITPAMGPAHSGLVVRAGFRAPDPESARLCFVVL
jgi:hypothetical protein